MAAEQEVKALHALVTSWFTPASIFLVLNIIIGTIALSSRFTGRKHRREEEGNDPDQQHQQIVRAPSSLLQRVRSFNYVTSHQVYPPDTNIATTDSSDEPTPVAAEKGLEREIMKAEEVEEAIDHPHDHQRGGGGRGGGGGGKVIRKTFSALLRGDEEVDAKADNFINRFRQQLRLQRTDSLLRYKDMLTGGGAS